MNWPDDRAQVAGKMVTLHKGFTVSEFSLKTSAAIRFDDDQGNALRELGAELEPDSQLSYSKTLFRWV